MRHTAIRNNAVHTIKQMNGEFSLVYVPFPFLVSLAGAKMVDAILLRTLRGVDGTLPPKMSLVGPPGGLRTLQKKRIKEKH